MDALEDAALHLTIPACELTLRHAILGIGILLAYNLSALLLRLVPDVDVFRTNNYIHRLILAEARIDAVEHLAAELDLLVLDHPGTQNVTLANEVCHKAVLRLIVDIGWCTDLLYFSLAHHHHAVG